jgi:hypothetical protein
VTFLGTLNDAPAVLNPSCTATATYAAYNNEYPYHELGSCGPGQEFLLEEAVIKCNGRGVKYFGYSCSNLYDGHAWNAYFACC